jgi:hypothetical protein
VLGKCETEEANWWKGETERNSCWMQGRNPILVRTCNFFSAHQKVSLTHQKVSPTHQKVSPTHQKVSPTHLRTFTTMSSTKNYAVAFDFATTRSVVGVWRNGSVEVL